MQNFCFIDGGQTLRELNSSVSGLTESEAQARLKKHGLNELERGKKAGIFKLFFSQFKDFMTVLLNDLTDTVIILSIIFLNAVVGTVQQFRADKAIENLKKLSACSVKVLRAGKTQVIDSPYLAVGDIVLLEEGDIVPAD